MSSQNIWFCGELGKHIFPILPLIWSYVELCIKIQCSYQADHHSELTIYALNIQTDRPEQTVDLSKQCIHKAPEKRCPHNRFLISPLKRM